MDFIIVFAMIVLPVACEFLIYGRLRFGFFAGRCLILFAALTALMWFKLHPDTYSDICLSGLTFCFGVGQVGGLIQVWTDIRDQKEGVLSKVGSSWNLFNDNSVFNQIALFVLPVVIVASFAASGYFFIQAQRGSLKAVQTGHKQYRH